MVNIDYLYNPDAVKQAFDKNYFLDKKLGFQVIEHGTILPSKSGGKSWFGLGGIVDSKGEYIRSSSTNDAFGGAYTPPPESIQHISETVIYLGLFFPVWGHDLTDNIRRLWFLNSDAFKNDFKNCPLVYVAWKGTNIELRPDFKRLLEILEVDFSNIKEITQPTQFERIILPDECFGSPFNKMVGFTNEYRELIDRVRNFGLKHSMSTSCKKLYFFHGKKGQLGEERLAEYLNSRGYEIINPEKPKLTFDEELNLLVNCESFASNLGSGSQNSVFCRDGTEIIIIPRLPVSLLDAYQLASDQVHSSNIITYIDSTLSIFGKDTAGGRGLYIVSEQLKRFFGDKWNGYEEEDFKTFLQYVKKYLGGDLTLNQGVKRYYSSVFEDFMSQLKRRENLITAYNMPPRWETFQPLTYQTHVYMKGWSDGWKCENEASNPLDQMLDVLAIKINFPGHKVYYSVYFNEQEGWSPEVAFPEIAGTVGIRKPIYGVRIRLDELGQKEFDILYRVHKFDGNWTPWAKNGETLYSYGQKLNALQIKLEPKT